MYTYNLLATNIFYTIISKRQVKDTSSKMVTLFMVALIQFSISNSILVLPFKKKQLISSLSYNKIVIYFDYISNFLFKIIFSRKRVVNFRNK